MTQRSLISCCLMLAVTAATSAVLASTASAQRADDRFAKLVRPFFRQHCQRCHDEELAEGDLRLDQLQPDFVARPAADHWVEVLDRINLGEMPPEGEPRPDDQVLTSVSDWIALQLKQARRSSESTDGRVLLRRLTRQEYANTIRDLLDVEFVAGQGPIDLLPPDGAIQGFDRNSKALLVDPSLLNAYLEVAQVVADRAIRFRPPIVPQRTVRFEFQDTVGSAMSYQLDGRSEYLDGSTLVVMQGNARAYAKLRHPYSRNQVPITGRYRVRIQAAADPGERGDPVYMRVRQGPSDSIAQFRVDAPPGKPQVYEFVTTRDQLFQGEYQVGIVNGTEFSRYVPSNGKLQRDADQMLRDGEIAEATRTKARLRAQGNHTTGAYRSNVLDVSGLPKLYLDWIEVTGPLQGEYPPNSMQIVFFEGWQPDQLSVDYADRIFARLLPRIYRRPVTAAEVNEITRLVKQELGRGTEFPTAIKTGLVAALCSPKFLFLVEPATPGNRARRLNDFELASRLSYFLWSSKPDDELFRAAASGHLSDPKSLAAQVDRMLADPRIEGFLQGFVRQWLKIDEFHRFPPDEQIFPQYYATEFAGLESDLTEQPLAMLRELIARDGSLIDLLDSDWTMVNERLARYYGIDGVEGEAFRRVTLPANARTGPEPPPAAIRGGLLGMAGVALWGSDGNRTKPVERGKYILDVLFNDPPPPPPPNAGEIEPNIRGEKLTVAERLALHRQQVTCKHCHRRIDPYGLALENFNVIGQWREQIDGEKKIEHWGDDRPAIEIDGTLPSGRRYQSFIEFKQALVAQDQRFMQGLTEKLLAFALARSIEPSDRPVIDAAVATAGREGNTLRSLVQQIVGSVPFREK